MGMSDRTQSLPAVRCGQILLLVAPRSFLRQALPPWIAQLAFNGPLRILDGGGRFNPYSLTRPLRRLTPRVAEAMQRVHIQRAFTCYQMTALLDEVCASDSAAPSNDGQPPQRLSGDALQTAPLLALDLLNTFHDEDVPAHERRRLLAGGLAGLNRLSRIAPVAVTVSLGSVETPSRSTPRSLRGVSTTGDGTVRSEMLEALEEGLENLRIWWFDDDPVLPSPPRLF
jgi:hypothetical protein